MGLGATIIIYFKDGTKCLIRCRPSRYEECLPTISQVNDWVNNHLKDVDYWEPDKGCESYISEDDTEVNEYFKRLKEEGRKPVIIWDNTENSW